MKVGDLVVHIGAKPNGYRARLVTGFGKRLFEFVDGQITERTTVLFVGDLWDWKDQCRKFRGWEPRKL